MVYLCVAECQNNPLPSRSAELSHLQKWDYCKLYIYIHTAYVWLLTYNIPPLFERYIQEEQTLFVHEHEAYPMMGGSAPRGQPTYVYHDSPMERGMYMFACVYVSVYSFYCVWFEYYYLCHVHSKMYVRVHVRIRPNRFFCPGQYRQREHSFGRSCRRSSELSN